MQLKMKKKTVKNGILKEKEKECSPLEELKKSLKKTDKKFSGKKYDMSEKQRKDVIESSTDDEALEQAILWSKQEKNDRRRNGHDLRRKDKLTKDSRKWASADD